MTLGPVNMRKATKKLIKFSLLPFVDLLFAIVFDIIAVLFKEE